MPESPRVSFLCFQPLLIIPLVAVTLVASMKTTSLLPSYYFDAWACELPANNATRPSTIPVAVMNSGSVGDSSLGTPDATVFEVATASPELTTLQPKDTPTNSNVKTNVKVDNSTRRKEMPPLSRYVDLETQTIKRKNLQELLDFAVVAFPKTGTTFLMRNWLGNHPEVCMYPEEMHLRQGTGVMNWTLLAERLYSLSPDLSTCQRAFKSPAFIRSLEGMQSLRDHWPQSKLVIGVRHPVWWFQSFYNYKTFRLEQRLPPPTVNMTCEGHGVCPLYANMHRQMAVLGLTTGATDEDNSREQELLAVQRSLSPDLILKPPLPHRVFLYDYSELHAEDLRLAFTRFLDLKQPLRKLGHYQNHQTLTKKPGQIDICDARHNAVRQQLVTIGKAAAEWIEEFFVLSPNVITTPSFTTALQDWKQDPCDDDNSSIVQQE